MGQAAGAVWLSVATRDTISNYYSERVGLGIYGKTKGRRSVSKTDLYRNILALRGPGRRQPASGPATSKVEVSDAKEPPRGIRSRSRDEELLGCHSSSSNGYHLI